MKRDLTRLERIYRAIDSLYESARKAYGFGCEGCADSCCLTKFYHYTLVEESYLLSGFATLPPDRKNQVLQRAKVVVKAYESEGEDARIGCPLYEEGLCILYAYRPMICRMHGVPYLTFQHNGSIDYGAGCSRFMSDQVGKDFVFYPFNRTAFYREVAEIERDVRAAAGVKTVPRKTIAEMLLQHAAG